MQIAMVDVRWCTLDCAVSNETGEEISQTRLPRSCMFGNLIVGSILADVKLG